MARGTTPLIARNSPAASTKDSSKRTSLLKNVLKIHHSPSVDKNAKHPFKFKAIRESPYKRPALPGKSKLETIREESPVEDDGPQNISATLSFRDLILEDLSGNEDDDTSSQDSDFDGWDDETTLVSKFQEHASEQSEQDKLVELAHQLEGPMQTRGDLLKRYLAHTIAPVARKVKNIHNVLEEKVDVTFGVAVLSFDDSCKKIEQPALRDEEELKRMYVDSQQNVKELFKELRDAYRKREQLWDGLQASIEVSAARAMTNLATLPSDLDDAILSAEKKAKEMSKSGGMDGKAKQKLLRDLLAEM